MAGDLEWEELELRPLAGNGEWEELDLRPLELALDDLLLSLFGASLCGGVAVTGRDMEIAPAAPAAGTLTGTAAVPGGKMSLSGEGRQI